MSRLRMVVPATGHSVATPNGTKVWLDDIEQKDVTKVELVGQVGQLWEVKITYQVAIESITQGEVS